MVFQPRLYAAAMVAACLGALVLSVGSAWSQAPAAPNGAAVAPEAPMTDGSGAAVDGAQPDEAPVPQLGQPAVTSAQAPQAAPPATAAQAPNDEVPEHQQERQQEVPLEHLKPTAPPSSAPAPPTAKSLPALAPVGALAGALPNTGVEPLALALTGLALLSMSVSLRAAAALRSA